MADLDNHQRITCRTMLYRAIRRQDGRHVVLDPDHMSHTTKIVDNDRDYDLAISLGWVGHPMQALERLESAEDAVSTDAAIRAYDDRRLSPEAQQEVAIIESTTVRHLPEIPEVSDRTEAQRKRGRPRKNPVTV